MKDAEFYAKYYWLSKLGRPVDKIYEILLSYFEGPDAAWEEASKGMTKNTFLPNIKLNERFYDASLREEALRICYDAMEKGIKLVCPEDNEYPKLLNKYSAKPYLLFYEGNLARLNECYSSLGVVGSRNCTQYGRSVTASICSSLAPYGIAVISGMARGIDYAAHKAALDSGMFTAAVLGCGTNIVYPAENVGIYKRIKAEGVIISEYPPGTRPFKSFFPARNRLIAGMSECVLVCEAGLSSGALITAGLAADDGRDVLAVPSNIDSSSGSGCNALIKSGAACITSYRDILNAMNVDTENAVLDGVELCSLSGDERKVFEYIRSAAGTEDEISAGTGFSSAGVKRILTVLEINGYVTRRYDGVYHTGKL